MKNINHLAIAKKHLEISESISKLVEAEYSDKVMNDNLRKSDSEGLNIKPGKEKDKKDSEDDELKQLSGKKEKIKIDPYLRVMQSQQSTVKSKYRED